MVSSTWFSLERSLAQGCFGYCAELMVDAVNHWRKASGLYMGINPEGWDFTWSVAASRAQQQCISAGWRASPEGVTYLKPWAGHGAELRSADNKDKMFCVPQAHCFWALRPKDWGYKNRKVLSNLPQPLKERMERRKTGKVILKAITWVMAWFEKAELLARLLDQWKLRDNSNIQVVPEKKENSWGS